MSITESHFQIFSITKLKEKFSNLTNYMHIIDYIENNTEEFLKSNQQELINKIYISQPTLSRFSKKLGFKNFKDFQMFVSKRYEQIHPEINLELVQENDIYDIKVNVLQQYNNLAKLIFNSTQDHQLKQLGEDIYNAKATILFGVGTSGILCHYLKRQLRQFGVTILVLESIHDFFECLESYNENCHFLLISRKFKTTEICCAAQILSDKKMPFSIISRNQNLAHLKPKNYIFFSFFSKKSFEFDVSTKIGVLMILDIIYFYIISKKDRQLLNIKKANNLVSKWNTKKKIFVPDCD